MKPWLFILLCAGGLQIAQAQQTIVVPSGDSIQPVIDQLSASGGGTCQLQAGTWRLSEPLKLRSNITLAGQGSASLLELPDGANYPAITNAVEGIINVVVRDLAINGRLSPAEQTLGPEYHTTPALQTVGRRHTFGIILAAFATDMEDVRIERVSVTRCAMGIHIKGARDVRVTDCALFENGIIREFYHNLYLRRVTQGLVDGCDLTNSPTGNGLNVSYSTNVTVLNSQALENYFRGFRFSDTPNVTNRFCLAMRNGDYGIVLEKEQTIPVSNFVVEGNRSEFNGRNGIFAQYASAGRINNNVALFNGAAEIATSLATNVVVQTNLTSLLPNIHEAERALLSGATVSWSNPGFSGSSYVNLTNASTGSVEWVFDNIPSAGAHLLEFRYANGSGTNRFLELNVNGETVASPLVFPAIGGWSSWALTGLNAHLNAGTNRVKLSRTSGDAPHVDYLKFTVNYPPIITHIGTRATNLITTAHAGGADAYVRGGANAGINYGSDSGLVLKSESVVNDFTRKVWLRFAFTTIPVDPVIDAELTLTLSSAPGVATPFSYNVYGLNNGHAGENWSESSITWNNAPGNDAASPTGVKASEALLLGTFTTSGTRAVGNLHKFSSAALRDFITVDTDKKITLILGRATVDAAAETFASKEHATLSKPTLAVITSSNITSVRINENSSTGPIFFTVQDVETPSENLIVTARASNTNLVPNESVLLGGSGATRAITITPAPNQFGFSVITLEVSDGNLSTQASFHLIVNTTNAPALQLNPMPELDGLELSWPATGIEFFPQFATNLAQPVAWMPVTNSILFSNGQNVLLLPLEVEKRFFRLWTP